MKEKELKLSEKGAKALEFLKTHSGEYTVEEMADVLDLTTRGIHGVMSPLVRAELVEKNSRQVPYLEESDEGKPLEVLKETKTFAITKKGQNFVG